MKILKFYAPWCMPCDVLNKRILELGDKISQVSIEEVNIDDERNSYTVKMFGIRSIPALIKVDENGMEIDRAVGMLQQEQLVKFLVD